MYSGERSIDVSVINLWHSKLIGIAANVILDQSDVAKVFDVFVCVGAIDSHIFGSDGKTILVLRLIADKDYQWNHSMRMSLVKLL
jgi:hypothetical protein